MKVFISVGVIVVASFGTIGVLRADETSEKSISLGEIVVTPTKSETQMGQTGRAVSVVSSEGLSETQGEFVSDTLSDIPGTLVRRSGSIGRTTTVVVRGASANQVHVTIDGVHVASPTTGAFDFANLMSTNLDRVEVLRGPASTLYGSDAMGGVVNVVTHRGEGPVRFSYTQEYGGEQTFREIGSLQGGIGKWHLSGAASRVDSNGLGENGAYQGTNLSTRIGYDFTNETKLDMTVRQLFSIIGIGDGAFRPDPNRQDRDRQTIASGKLETQVTPWWSQMFRVSSQVGKLVDSDPSNGGSDPNFLFLLNTQRYGGEWLNRFSPVEWDSVTVGTEYEDRRGDNRSFVESQSTWATYIQNQWKPMDPLMIVTGLRYFREKSFGWNKVFDTSAAYFVSPLQLNLRGGYGQGFRVPTLNELFFPDFGNPNLSPERSHTFEFGVDQGLFGEKATLSGTVFRTDYKQLIQAVSISSTSSQAQNVGKARVDGIELEAKVKLWKPWMLTSSYTHLEANQRPSMEQLLRIPKNTVSCDLTYSSTSKWKAGLKGYMVSSREESTGFNSRNKTKGYPKLDFFTQYQFKPWIKGYVRVENMTNRTYSEVLGFPSPGTLASFGITIEE